MDWLTNPEVWSALAALLALEVVLGVDNVVFISILASKLPAEEQERARKIGLLAAGGMRIVLLLAVGWIVTLKAELFTLFDIAFTGKDLVLLAGGIFLIYKATKEIHHKLEGEEGEVSSRVAPTFGAVIGQILLLDLVFSVDSVITAVGMTDHVAVMIVAVMTAVGIMLFASKAIFTFVSQHPTVKMLALSFLLLIGMTLVAEGLHQKIPKGFIYATIAFSVFVEFLNLRAKAHRATATEPVHLHQPIVENPVTPTT